MMCAMEVATENDIYSERESSVMEVATKSKIYQGSHERKSVRKVATKMKYTMESGRSKIK